MADEPGDLLQRHLLLMGALCDSRTSKGDCKVLAVITSHVNKETGTAWPGVNRIAKLAGIHRTTVLASINRLEEFGFVEIVRKRGCAHLYRMATGSADATTDHGEPVAPTRPVAARNQSGLACATSSAHTTELVAPTLQNQSRPRYPNSVFNSVCISEKATQVPAALGENKKAKEPPALIDLIEPEPLPPPVDIEAERQKYEGLVSKWGESHPVSIGYLNSRPYLMEKSS